MMKWSLKCIKASWKKDSRPFPATGNAASRSSVLVPSIFSRVMLSAQQSFASNFVQPERRAPAQRWHIWCPDMLNHETNIYPNLSKYPNLAFWIRKNCPSSSGKHESSFRAGSQAFCFIVDTPLAPWPAPLSVMYVNMWHTWHMWYMRYTHII